MSAKPVNLNRVRKQKARAAKTATAAANALRFGRDKAQKARDAAASEKARRDLDNHRRET